MSKHCHIILRGRKISWFSNMLPFGMTFMTIMWVPNLSIPGRPRKSNRLNDYVSPKFV